MNNLSKKTCSFLGKDWSLRRTDEMSGMSGSSEVNEED